MNNIGEEFSGAVGGFLESLALPVEREYPVQVGIDSKSTKKHRFDWGSSEVLVECKCYGWTLAGKIPSAKISALNEAMLYFHTAPVKYRKMLFLPVRLRPSARNPQTLAEYYVRLYGHFIPATVEVWELEVATGSARQINSAA